VARNLPRSGVTYNLELDYAMAAQWWGHHSIETFAALVPEEQAYLVAVYRANSTINSVIAHQQARDSEAAAKRNKRTS
jgi:hypothetical protein